MHIMKASEGTYVTAHRHGLGAQVIVIGGDGYELLFMPGYEKNRRRVPAKPYSVISPFLNEFHGHFITGKGGHHMLAFRCGGIRYGSGLKHDPARTAQSRDPFAQWYKILYEQEDPSIREEYYKELEQNGSSLCLAPLDQGRG